MTAPTQALVAPVTPEGLLAPVTPDNIPNSEALTTWREVWVGPAEAQLLLEENHNNRALPERKIEQFTSDMVNGNWRYHGDVIHRDWNGSLLNGQQRLHAIIRSGTRQRFILVEGLDPETWRTIDIGATRTAADAMAREGVKYAKTVAGALTYVWGYENEVDFGGPLGGSNGWEPSNATIHAALQAHPEIHEAAAIGQRLGKALRVPPSILAFRYWQFGQIDSLDYGPATEDRDDFFDRLLRWDFRGETDPLRLLYLRLVNNGVNKSSRLDTVEKHALIVKAWNRYRRGNWVQRLAWRRRGSKAEPFPEAI